MHALLFRARRGFVLVAAATACAGALGTTPLADQPIFSDTNVPGNLALALSVEFPTAVSVAHINNTYSSATVYMGYFDTKKCYSYSWNATESLRHFYPDGLATNQTCPASTKWSGNFLNWATMQTVDPFRSALTGGYRSLDTTSMTLLEKAWASGQGGTGNFPNRGLGSAALVSAATPLNWSALSMRIQGLGNKMRFTRTGNLNGTPVEYTGGAATDSVVYEVSVRVKVCDASAPGGVEANCTAYPNSGNQIYKPTGLLQQYAKRIRYSAFGYLNDSNLQRDGGVMRARQKFIGPQLHVPTQLPTANPATEWDENTGIIHVNPNATDAADTATVFGVPVSNSGVMNYLNKFGQITPGSYKTYDPVGELYYAAVRYFKKLGNVPEWTNMGSASTSTKTTWVDGFPVITTWDDPIQYSCQKNFVLGIGDVNTHADKNVPGSGMGSTNEPARPSALSLDPVDAVLATNKVGSLHGLGSSLGTAENYNGCCSNNSALMAGIAYDSNTKDIRPDNPSFPQTLGRQTVKTYWLDILEFQTYKQNNQFYLAAKYGGFKVPSVFDPYAQATDIPQAWWSTTGDTVGGQPRPDTYFVASNPKQMIDGLNGAFKAIANDLNAFTTSFSPSSPQVSSTGTASYSAKYDASTWTGEITASTMSFDEATGTPSPTEAWLFSAKLTAQIAASGGMGWDGNRRIVTRRTDTGVAVPFRWSNLSSAQQGWLDTAYRSGNDGSDYLNYLRGDPTHEENSSATGSAKAYRNRASPVGDIVGSKTRPVGPPSANYSEAANPGYAAFKAAHASRQTVVYVGSNAGMLHAINGATTGTSAGQELWAYIPSVLFQGPTGDATATGLAARGDPDFTHRYFVDGTPTVVDIDFNKTSGASGSPDWRTVLIGSLGKGGRSYFAIDVTNPAAMTTETAVAGRVLWEFSHADLGYTYGEPAVVKTKKHGWVAIFGSGYNNADGRPYFFIVNARTGALLEKIEAKEANGSAVGGPSNQAGLAQVQVFVPDRTDFTAETAYAGDLLGNLWRLDLTPTGGSYATPTKLAELTDYLGNPVPVTSRPLVVIQPITGKRFVTVGSGRFLDSSDVSSTQSQVFYGVIDGTASIFAATAPTGFTYPITRSRLKQITDLTVKNLINPATQIGWWYDLGTGAGGLGWRVISDPTAFYGIVAFAAMLPNGDVCNASGKSRIFAIDVGEGDSALLQGNNVLAYNDSVQGVVTDLRWLSVNKAGGGSNLRLMAGSDKGEIKPIEIKQISGQGLRRLNWRELPLAD
jgi:type IV pilus assembly protein PilY1